MGSLIGLCLSLGRPSSGAPCNIWSTCWNKVKHLSLCLLTCHKNGFQSTSGLSSRDGSMIICWRCVLSGKLDGQSLCSFVSLLRLSTWKCHIWWFSFNDVIRWEADQSGKSILQDGCHRVPQVSKLKFVKSKTHLSTDVCSLIPDARQLTTTKKLLCLSGSRNDSSSADDVELTYR